MRLGQRMVIASVCIILELDPRTQSNINNYIFSITKTGKRTFTGTVNHKMRSLMRFFTQFSDTRKHEAIHQLVNSPDFKTSSVTLHGPEP